MLAAPTYSRFSRAFTSAGLVAFALATLPSSARAQQAAETPAAPAAAPAEPSTEPMAQPSDGLPLEAAYAGGFVLRSENGDFRLKIGGYAQVDARFYLGDEDDRFDSGFVTRRLRASLEATAFKFFGFKLLTDFSGGRVQLYDGYGEIKAAPFLRFRAGKMRPPIGLERIQLPMAMFFIERGLPANLSPIREVGAQVFGGVGNGALFYALGVFNGAADNTLGELDNTDDKDFMARVFFRPFRLTDLELLHEVGVGVAASTGVRRGTPDTPDLPQLRSPGQQVIFSYPVAPAGEPPEATAVADGQLLRFEPHLYAFVGPVGVLAQVVAGRMTVTRGDATVTQTVASWQVAAQAVVTGDRASYGGVVPKRPVGLGGFGAVSVEARVGQLDPGPAAFDAGIVDRATSIQRADSFGVGVSEHFNRAAKLQVNFDRTTFQGGAPGTGDRAPENFLSLRLQVLL